MLGIVAPAQHNQTIYEPETAKKKCGFISRKAIIRLLQVISQHKSIDDQLAFDGLDGCNHTSVRCWQEADERDEQETRIQCSRTITLHKRAHTGIKSVLADIFVNLVAQAAPVIERSSQFEALKIFDSAIHSHPRHHFRVRELLSPSTNLPDAVIRLHPNLFEIGYPVSFYGRTLFRDTGRAFPGLMHRIRNFAIDIELELGSSGIADAYWFGVLVTRQPGHLPLNQAPFACNAVHDLILRRFPGNGSQ